MSKTEQTEDKISVCDVMKNNSSKIIKKIESKSPPLIQKYSDFYMQYLHTIDDIFGTCYISEKEFFDKLNLDQNTLKAAESLLNSITAMYLNQIELSSKYMEAHMETRISLLKTYDDFVHTMMESYAKNLAQLNKSIGPS